VTVVRASGDTRVRIRSGGQVLYSALSVARKIRRVLCDLAESLARPQAALAANAGNRNDKEIT